MDRSELVSAFKLCLVGRGKLVFFACCLISYMRSSICSRDEDEDREMLAASIIEAVSMFILDDQKIENLLDPASSFLHTR
jgi:hypothetical protein